MKILNNYSKLVRNYCTTSFCFQMIGLFKINSLNFFPCTVMYNTQALNKGL